MPSYSLPSSSSVQFSSLLLTSSSFSLSSSFGLLLGRPSEEFDGGCEKRLNELSARTLPPLNTLFSTRYFVSARVTVDQNTTIDVRHMPLTGQDKYGPERSPAISERSRSANPFLQWLVYGISS
ncbi:uncharacterized protein BDV17DRAFT_276101 [Aspergillus undulatus]|uniref:uncharacterized protein n=1 Tax=Aspergillus undulatus TaxID=1810928 RepID=UPI003CCD13B6